MDACRNAYHTALTYSPIMVSLTASAYIVSVVSMYLAAILWDVKPEIVSIGPITIRWYGILFSSGFLLGYIMMSRMFIREGRPLSDMEPLTLYMIGGTVIGMRLGHCLFYQPDYYLAHPIEILEIWKGGYASHGAVVGISIALWLYSRSRPNQPFLWIIDRIAIVVALAGCLIRIGNFFNHEMIGHQTSLPWAVIFAQRDSIPRHPSQLYEALCYLATFLLMRFLYQRYDARAPYGLLLGVFFVCVFGARFLIEFTKENQVAFEQGLPLNMGQILSVPLIILGGLLIWRAQRQPQAVNVSKTSPLHCSDERNDKHKKVRTVRSTQKHRHTTR
ncbi:MAG: prolipoprotein diacylglyceryl transferase [Bacteroidota bacterium]|nr:prolipoprotein diacylglyceryl transferase [Candidatus Kapabacteria bacterium]MDW8219364.1 prolipoprotein diacylglyceryl transferase [Bacteroidota bacterium]